jgi:hypothetical protein
MRWSSVKRRRRVLAKDAILGLEILNHVALLLVDPSRERDHQKAQRVRNCNH